jgi:DNA ligase 1
VKLFADLIDRLAHALSQDIKIVLLVDYLRRAPDPDRGFALSMLVDDLEFKPLSSAMIRRLGEGRIDPALFAMSHDFIGDLAETKALIWPDRASNHDVPTLPEVAGELAGLAREDVLEQIELWLDTMDATERWAFLKLVSGRLGAGVSPKLARMSLAAFGGVGISAIEEVWHGLERPYTELFDWLEGRNGRPSVENKPIFRPIMRASPLDMEKARELDLAAYVAEWKWDGLGVQLSARGQDRRLYSSAGDDISEVFPEIVEALFFDCVLDGQLLVGRAGEAGFYEGLRYRLSRKSVSASTLEVYPARVRLHDVLFDGSEDLRGLPFWSRRQRLEALVNRNDPPRMDVSELMPFQDHDDLTAFHNECRERGMAGIMLKRRDGPYVAGREKAGWFKWKREPLIIDTVLMYAERGRGAGSTRISEITLGAWRDSETGAELVPVGKTMFDANLADEDRLDEWIREHTVKRYGPVSEVERALVVELAFDGVLRSTRHKAKLVLREPMVLGVRWDRPATEAARIECLEGWIR